MRNSYPTLRLKQTHGSIYLLILLCSVILNTNLKAQEQETHKHEHLEFIPAKKVIENPNAIMNVNMDDSLAGFDVLSTLNEAERLHVSREELPYYIKSRQKAFLQAKYPSSTERVPGPPPSILACNNESFESGTTAGWTGFNGTNNGCTPNCAAASAGATTAIVGPGTDPCIPALSTVAPGGGGFSCQLGNNGSYGDVNAIQQSFVVTAGQTMFTYQYAIVLENPVSGHTAPQMPYFSVEVRDQGGNFIPCGNYDVQFATGAANFTNFTGACGTGIYRNWTTVTVDLTAYVGQTISIRYIVAGCGQGGHFGYAYIDANCSNYTITGASAVCNGLNATLTAPAGMGSYSWSGPGIVGPNNGQSITANATGTYTCTMTSVAGCPVPPLTHSLSTGPNPTASFTNSNAPCNMNFSFTDASTVGSGSITGWAWDFGEGGATSTTQNPSYTYTTPGIHTVTLTATSNAGCIDTYTATVNVPDVPVAAYTYTPAGGAATPVCPGVTINFTDASTSPLSAITGWAWDFGDPASGAANTSSLQNPSHTFSSAGTFGVSFTVTNAGTCTSVTSQTVVINPNPLPAFTSNNVCFNVCTQFTNTTPAAPAIGSWAWDFTNDGTTDDATQAPCFTYAAAGTFVAELTATTTAGCVGTFTANVVVNPNPVASFTASTECVNDATQFDGSASSIAAPDNIAFYNWTYGDGNSNSGITQSHTYAACGTYTANLVVVSNNNCTHNTNVTVTVKCRPTVTVPTNTVVCPATAIPATAFSSNPVGATYEWSNTVTAIGLGSGPTAGDVPGFTTTNTGSTQLDAQITVTPTLSGCVGTPSTYVVSVKPTPVMNPIASATYCPNTAVAPADFTTIPTGSTFDWTNSDPTIGLGTSGTTPYAGFNSINSGSTTLVSTITVTPTLAACVGLPLTYSITVNPTPVVSVPATAQYCPGDLVPATGFTSVPPGATFNWTNSDATIGVNSISPGQIAGFNATNTSAIVHSGIITVTPTLNNCAGLPVAYTITVKPTPYVNATFDVFECPQVNVTANNFTSTPTGATMAWIHTNANVGLATTSGTNSVPAFTTANGVASNEVSTLTITPTLNGCIGPDSSYTITVKPTPVLALTPSNSYCPNVTVVNSPNFTTVPPGSTINWTNNNTSIGLAASGIDDYANFVPLNTGSTNQVAIITPTPTLNGCVGLPQPYSITVYPKPIAVVPANSEACPADPITGFVFGSIPNDPLTVYSWTHSEANVGLSQGAATAVNTSSTNNFSATNVNTTLLTTNFTVITQLNGCLSDPENFTFTVNPLPTPVFEASHTCEGDATTFTSLSTVGSGSITTWQWDFDNNGVNEMSGGNSAPSYGISGVGTHTIHLTVITDKSCINDVIRTMYINPNPVPTVLVDDPDGCPDHTVLMSAAVNPTSVDHANSILSWAWDVESNGNTDSLHIYPAGSQADVLGYTYTNSSPVSSQFYQVTLTATSDSGCVGTLVTTPTFITVFAHPTADFSYGPADPEPNVQNPLVSFYDQSQGATNWLWAFNDPLSSIQGNASTLQNPQHYYDSYEAGTYDVTLIINNGQCWDTIVKPVIIQPDWTFFIPNAFSPNGDGINEGFRGTGVGIEKYSLMIFDRWGMLIWSTDDLDKEWDGKVAGKSKTVQEDVYIWKVKFKDGKNTNHQFEGTVTVVR